MKNTAEKEGIEKISIATLLNYSHEITDRRTSSGGKQISR
jgi:hypothetical protein